MTSQAHFIIRLFRSPRAPFRQQPHHPSGQERIDDGTGRSLCNGAVRLHAHRQNQHGQRVDTGKYRGAHQPAAADGKPRRRASGGIQRRTERGACPRQVSRQANQKAGDNAAVSARGEGRGQHQHRGGHSPEMNDRSGDCQRRERRAAERQQGENGRHPFFGVIRRCKPPAGSVDGVGENGGCGHGKHEFRQVQKRGQRGAFCRKPPDQTGQADGNPRGQRGKQACFGVEHLPQNQLQHQRDQGGREIADAVRTVPNRAGSDHRTGKRRQQAFVFLLGL